MTNIGSILDDVNAEIIKAQNKWGPKFDEQNTLNDWAAFISMYATDAAKISIQDNSDEIYRKLIKTAGLAVSAAYYVRSGQVSPRHYDITLGADKGH